MSCCMVFWLRGWYHKAISSLILQYQPTLEPLLLYNTCVNYLNIIPKHSVKVYYPQHAVQSQAATGTQVDASVLGLSALTQTALGTGWLLCHKTGRQPAMPGWVGLQRVL